MVKQKHQLFVAMLAVSDAMVIALACYFAWFVRHFTVGLWWPRSWENYFKEPVLVVVVPVVLMCMWAFGLYRPRRDRSIWSEIGQLLKASIFAVAALVVVLWMLDSSIIRGSSLGNETIILGHAISPGRVQLGTLLLMLPILLVAHRAAFRLTLRCIRARGRNLRHVAIIGTGRLGQIAGRTISRNSWTGINISYYISHEPVAERTSCLTRPVRGGLENVEAILEEYKVDAVYLALPNSSAAELPRLLRILDKFPLDVRYIPDVPPRYVPHSMQVGELEGMPILSYRECPLYGLGGFTKRLVDIVGAAFAIFIFMPIMLLIAAAIRLTSPGPVIFKQKRVGLGGESFTIYKFRTMTHADGEEVLVADDDPRAHWTKRNDARITTVGAWIRATSLDELPQLFNVLRGEMSLVGPRPERPELIERFREDWRGYILRQHVKAGMTGWAQVKGLRGDTDLRKRLQHDLFYIRHWSLGFDLKILWLTLFRGFIHRNAH